MSRHSASWERWRLAVPAVVGALWLAGLRVEGLQLALVYLAPVVALATLLLTGRYPGARVLERYIARRRVRRRIAAGPVPRRRRSHRLLPRGGRLVAAGLAGRPPPGR